MIEIKITGNSIPELADKLLAMGRAMQAQSSHAADNAAREAMQAERDRARATINPEQIAAVADASAPTLVEAERILKEKRTRKKAEPAPVTVVEDAAEEQVDAETGEVTEGTVPHIDDAMAATLKAVERVGRDKVVAILSQFGAAKARDVPEAQRAEYITMLGDA